MTEIVEKWLVFTFSIVFFMIIYYFSDFEVTIILILLVILNKMR
jgi:hypothetical protein